MAAESYQITGVVKLFQVEKPWVYISVPKLYTDMFQPFADRGLVAIMARVGGSTWPTSLMPMGDGTQFIPLSAKIRKAEGIEIGRRIKCTFWLRKR